MKKANVWFLAFLIIFASMSVGFAAEDQSMRLPAPTGNYGVGTIAMPLVDQTRPGKYDDGKESKFRELMVQIWYPAGKQANPIDSYPYMDDCTAEYIIANSPIPGSDERDVIKLLKSIQTNSVGRAPAAKGIFPVLIFSPGYGMVFSLYQTLLEDLASHGYIVVAVNHPNISGITAFPDGHFYTIPQLSDDQVIPYLDNHFKDIVTDLKFVMTQLGSLNTNPFMPFTGKLDLGRIACFGHSLGGAVSVQACIERSDLSAAADIDGTLRWVDSRRPIYKPVLILNNDIHNSVTDNTLKDIWTNLHWGSYMIEVNETRHGSFSDMPVLLDLLPQTPELQTYIHEALGFMDPARAVAITRYITRTFFDCNLKYNNPCEMEQLDEKFTEVWVKTKK